MQLSTRLAHVTVAASLLLAPALAGAQPAPKARYLVDRSFQLPPKGQPGAPDDPSAVGPGPGGTIHVADEDGRVFVYDSTGIYRRSYGERELKDPVAIAVDAAGIAYVLDENRNQVAVFGPGGQALRAIGAKGNRGGELSNPVDFALGPNGYVYILDEGKKSVEIFSADGLFVRAIAVDQVVREPLAIAVGRDGWIYVTDKHSSAANRIYAYPPFTELPWTGPPPMGSAARVEFRGARFDEPIAVAVSEHAVVTVLDKRQGRLWSRSPHVGEESVGDDHIYGGSGTGRGSFKEAVDIAMVGLTGLLILDKNLRKVERVELTVPEGARTRPAFDFPVRVTFGPRSLPAPLHAVGHRRNGAPLFLLEVGKNTLSLIGAQTELHATVYGDTVPAYSPDPKVFQREFTGEVSDIGSATLNDRIVVLTDPRRDRFAVFGLEDGALKGTFGDNYRDERRLNDPHGVALLPDGRIVICDTRNDRLKIFSADMASLVASYPFEDAYGVAVGPQGDLLVWDRDGHMIRRLRAGSARFEILREGLVPVPVASMTFDRSGNLFVLNRETQRVTVIEAGLTRVLVQLGNEGSLNRVERVVVDDDGNIYVVDGGAARRAIYRWDMSFPPLAGLTVGFESNTAVLEWAPGPERYVRGYEVQGATARDGPYRRVGMAADPSFRIEAASFEGPLPRYIRVAPVYITGTRGGASPIVPVLNFSATAALERGDHAAALEDARAALALIEDGTLAAGQEAKANLLWVAFSSAYAMGDHAGAVKWGEQLAPIAPRHILIEFLFRMAHSSLREGDPRGASQHLLTLVGQGPRPEYFEDRAVVDMSFRVFHALQRAGLEGDALDFLRFYARAIPTAAAELKESYEDSIGVYDTRTKLGPGFDYWRSASYADAIRYFEEMIRTAELTPRQEVLCREILAAGYYAFGRRSDAEDTFREIYRIDPAFDLDGEIARVRELYGLTIYNPETRRFFAGLRTRPSG